MNTYFKDNREWVSYKHRRPERVYTLDDGTKLTARMLVDALNLKRPAATYRLNNYTNPEVIFSKKGSKCKNVEPKKISINQSTRGSVKVSAAASKRNFFDPMSRLFLKMA